MGRNLTDGPKVGYWVAQQTEGAYFEEKSQAIGLEADGKLIAGVIYENWNGRSVVCHIAILGAVTKSWLGMIFKYAFVTCGAAKIIAPVCSENKVAIKLVTKMGFTEEARVKDAAENGDIIFFTMRPDACRYLEVRYG
jgi:RimJ/RimL family protein N-acetyltransferase